MEHSNWIEHYCDLAYIAYESQAEAVLKYRAMGYEVKCEPTLARGTEEVFFLNRGSHVVVAIAGSNELLDWLRNFTALPSTVAHSGYERSAIQILGPLKHYISRLPQKPATITFVGHSKGGAVAGMLHWLTEKFYKDFGIQVRSFTYGAPRWLNYSLIDMVDLTHYHRIVNPDDIVARVPFNAMGYKHCGKVFVRLGPNYYDEGEDAWFEAKQKYPVWKLLIQLWKVGRSHDYIN